MKRTILITLMLIFLSSSSQAALIQNGNFESGPVPGPSGLIIVPKPGSPILTSIAILNWNVTENNVDYIQDGALGLSAQDGSKMIDLTGGDDGFATIVQMLTLEAGKRYRLEFYIGGSDLFVAAGQDNGNPGVVVSLSGIADMTFFGSRNSANDWQLQSLTFVAVQTNTLLSFTGTQTDLCCYIGLDNVDIKPVTEPAILFLFGLGLAALGLSTRRRAR